MKISPSIEAVKLFAPHQRYLQNLLFEVFKGYSDKLTNFLHHQEKKHSWELGLSFLWPLKIVVVRERGISEYEAWSH